MENIQSTSDAEIKINGKMSSCVDAADSSAATNQCALEALNAWDKQLNGQYNALMTALGEPNSQQALRQAQRAWLAYEKQEFNAIENIFGRSDSILVNETDLVKNRAKELESIRVNKTNMD